MSDKYLTSKPAFCSAFDSFAPAHSVFQSARHVTRVPAASFREPRMLSGLTQTHYKIPLGIVSYSCRPLCLRIGMKRMPRIHCSAPMV
jgi:hypothetical protein